MTTTTEVRLADGWHAVSDGTLTINGQPFEFDDPDAWPMSALVRFHEPPQDDEGEGAWVTTTAVAVLAVRTLGPAGATDQ